ncbi:hypothetical protein O4J55_28600 [Paracoccus sp. PXZ]
MSAFLFLIGALGDGHQEIGAQSQRQAARSQLPKAVRAVARSLFGHVTPRFDLRSLIVEFAPQLAITLLDLGEAGTRLF